MIYKVQISQDLLDIFRQGNCVTKDGDNYYHYPFTLKISDAEINSELNNDTYICDLYTKNDLPNDVREILYDEKRTNKKDK